MPFVGHGMLTELVSVRNVFVVRCTDILAKTWTFSAGLQAAKRTTRIKLTALVAMDGDVQHGWIVVEGTLGTVA